MLTQSWSDFRKGLAGFFERSLEGLGYRVFIYPEGQRSDPIAEFHRWADPRRYDTVATTYTHREPFPWKTYSPWFDKTFVSVYDKVRGLTLLPEDRCYYIHHLAEYCAHLGGDMAECGVFRGGSAYLIALALGDSPIADRHLHLFDTFNGMPEEHISTRDPHVPNQFANTSAAEVTETLRDFPFVEVHPGAIPMSLSSIDPSTKFSFVHLDVDLYSTNKSCCEFFYSRMCRGGVLLFDEYGFRDYELTERRAVDEFFEGLPEHPLVLPTGQCVVLKC